jgi:hypothetical protein
METNIIAPNYKCFRFSPAVGYLTDICSSHRNYSKHQEKEQKRKLAANGNGTELRVLIYLTQRCFHV